MEKDEYKPAKRLADNRRKALSMVPNTMMTGVRLRSMDFQASSTADRAEIIRKLISGKTPLDKYTKVQLLSMMKWMFTKLNLDEDDGK